MGRITMALRGLRKEALGLTIIAASLIVIAVVVLLLFDYQRDSRVTRTRSHGVSLVRLLSEMPLPALSPESGRNDVLQALIYTGENTDLLYATIISMAGEPIADVSHSGVLPPPFQMPKGKGIWAGEREIALDGNTKALEFFAPVFDGPERAGYVRIGYLKPPFAIGMSQLPFIASIALPVFLLAPLFHFLLRREISPIHKANDRIGSLLEKGRLEPVRLEASGELGDFMQRFNAFIGLAQSRIDALQSEQDQLLTRNRLIQYRRTRIERVLDALPYSVLVMDESGQATYVSQKLASLFDISSDAINDNPPHVWCPLPDVASYLVSVAKRGRGGFVMEALEFTPPRSVDRTVAVQAFPLFEPRAEDQVLGALVIFRDVTEETMARRSRGEFVAHIAHELKTPLGVLAMYAEGLQDNSNDESFRVEATNVIADEVERLSELISNLLSITKIETGSLSIEKQLVKPLDLLKDAFETVQRSGAGGDLEFILDLPPDIGAILADKEMLRIAINNLLTNAIKYNRPGGKVTLSVEDSDEFLQIFVRDTGIGISEEDVSHVFEKFYRSDEDEVRSRPGHGLGLALSRDIVQIHNGTLSVASEAGVGSVFTLRLWRDAAAVRKAI